MVSGWLFFALRMLDPYSFFDDLETMRGLAFGQFARGLLLLETTSIELQQWLPFGA
tara:strand:+ start:1113 stop:1280 length:168 start_codon:yes stop_codon:yes gene_type:complete